MIIAESDKYRSRAAVITGANGGIGKSIAIELASHGMNLILCTRQSSDEWENWINSLKATYDIEIQTVQFDFADQDEVKDAAKLITKNNTVDFLINCAGMPFGATVLMTRLEDLHKVMDVNFVHQVLFTQYFIKGMYSRKNGAVVNIASISGVRSGIGTLAYGASKAALIHLTRVLASESGKYGVRVNAICPGAIQTKMLDAMDPEPLERLVSDSALGRAGLPSEVAKVVEFLLSDSSSYISGQAIHVNGGEKC
jgi:3-oxoacyl-[acyl-carrier protein] reductase